jgi:hypothetical protein
MRLSQKFLWFTLILVGCGSAPPPAPVAQAKPDPTQEQWYAPAAAELAALNRDAEKLLGEGKSDEAAAVVKKGQALESRLLAAPEPSLEAMQSSSDLDDLYGRLLMRTKQYGWARQVFQKNVIRWKNWKPQTPDTTRRLKTAVAAVAECDRLMTE